MASLCETATRLHDPRVNGRSRHHLADIERLAVLAVSSRAESYEAIEKFGKVHYDRLKSMENGICLGLCETRDKSNETTAIPKLLDMLWSSQPSAR